MSRLLTVLSELCNQGSVINFDYVNYRGEFSTRETKLHKLYFGQTQYHPEEQWLIEAKDIEKGETRTFALNDMTNIMYGTIQLAERTLTTK